MLPLNHSYVVVKPATFKAIRDSQFIKDHFAFTHFRTTTNNTTTYSGFYVFGDNTYLEVFEEGNNPYAQPGHLGVAFGCDTSGEFEKLKNRLTLANEIPFKTELMHKKVNGESLPWFSILAFDYQDLCPELMAWFMEYRPDYGDLNGDVSRKNYLDKTFRSQSVQNKNFILEDFIQVNLTLTEPVADRFNKQLLFLGHTVKNQISISSGNKNSLTSLVFSTKKEFSKPETIDFGIGCQIILGPGKFGEWVFA